MRAFRTGTRTRVEEGARPAESAHRSGRGFSDLQDLRRRPDDSRQWCTVSPAHVSQDPVHHPRLGDEAQEVHLTPAVGAQQRNRELGIRMALGAQSRDMMHMIVRQGVRLSLLGIAVGLVLAVAVSEGLSHFLWGLSPFDPLTFGAATGLLFATSLVAIIFPARQATRADPIILSGRVAGRDPVAAGTGVPPFETVRSLKAVPRDHRG